MRPSPRSDTERGAERSNTIASPGARAVAIDVLDVSRPSGAGRTLWQGLVSLAGAAGIALLVPFAFVLVGLPVVAAVRGVLDGIAWLIGIAIN